MDLFNEIDDLSDLFLSEKNAKLDSAVEGFEDLQSKYSSLHEDYAKELENSKKVEKSLVKCLKFYSKLCKKYEAQQKLISSLKETVKEKILSLEEAQRNEEKMKGLIQVYRTERAFYVGQTNSDLRKDKEILLDICCRLIGESVKTNNIRNLTNLLLRKFKKDLDDDKINLLKKKTIKFKSGTDCDPFLDVKSDFSLKNETDFKTEEKYSEEISETFVKEPDDPYATSDPLDLSISKHVETEDSHEKDSHNAIAEDDNTAAWPEIDEPALESSLPSLGELPPLPELPLSDSENTPDVSNNTESTPYFQQSVSKPAEEVQLQSGNVEINEEHPVIVQPVQPRNDLASSLEESESIDRTRKNLPPETGSKSIFDISDPRLKASDLKVETKQEVECLESEVQFGVLFESQTNPDVGNGISELGFGDPEEDPDFEELYKILREMSSVRLPSPVKDICDSGIRNNGGSSKRNKTWDTSKLESAQKRTLVGEESRSKKLKPEEETPNGGLLDSIMSAMSLQNEEFKSKGLPVGESEGNTECAIRDGISRFSNVPIRTYSKRKRAESGNSKENSSGIRQSPRINQSKQHAVEQAVMEEIKNFVSSPMSSKEDADKNVKHCISILSNKPAEIIAKCIVSTVLENVDEVVETFERPAPPLTKTQHRLIVLLSVFRTLDSNSEKISSTILDIISQKLFPDNFFWPDDSVEAATRFYAALCRARNDPKTLWRFCLQAMTDMRQRCPLLAFTVLKTWPDVLYDAATLKNNTLAVTIVNIFLHMPKMEGLRNVNQGRKLIALKHLLMNFYQFKVEDTIEGYTSKVFEAFRRQETGAKKSIILLSKCRDAKWTAKHVVPGLKSILSEWVEEKVDDVVASKVLCVIKQICPVLLHENSKEEKIKEIISCLSEIIISSKQNHTSEVNIIEVLLQLKQYPEARKIIREWIPKSPINDCLRNEIINVSAENILRELKLNKKKESKSVTLKKKSKKQRKKSKGKETKGRAFNPTRTRRCQFLKLGVS